MGLIRADFAPPRRKGGVWTAGTKLSQKKSSRQGRAPAALFSDEFRAPGCRPRWMWARGNGTESRMAPPRAYKNVSAQPPADTRVVKSILRPAALSVYRAVET
jgi:hypothetical protein